VLGSTRFWNGIRPRVTSATAPTSAWRAWGHAGDRCGYLATQDFHGEFRECEFPLEELEALEKTLKKRAFTLQTHDLADCWPQLPKYFDGTPPRLGNSVLTLIENILINIVNRSITLSKETDFVFNFLSENIKTTGCADRTAGANRIS
jgi:hypothetical protein